MLSDHKNRRSSIQPKIEHELNILKAVDMLWEISLFCRQTLTEKANQPFDPSQVLTRSRWYISFRLDEFLANQRFVHFSNKNKKHHQMRIAAKKLRYTMEFFAPLYQNQLKEQIETIKKYQDLLGEKHDNEVWIEYIPQFIEKLAAKRKKPDSAKLEGSLRKFLLYLKRQRLQNYRAFVKLWEENKKNDFFNNLRSESAAESTLTETQIQQTLSTHKGPIGVISDIHGNFHALECVFEDAKKRGVNVFVNAGDTVGYGAFPNEVVELLCDKGVFGVLGNYDLEVLEGKVNVKGPKRVAYKFAKKELSKSSQCYLESLPRELRFEVAGKKLLITHGSPKSINEHLTQKTPTEKLKSLAENAKADVIIVGHSHEQFQKQVKDVCFVNPGSVGRPGDGNPQTAYAILWFNPFKVELIRLNYDVTVAAKALRKKGLPESFAQMLLRGISLDEVLEDDRKRHEMMTINPKETANSCRYFAAKYWPDTEHYTQVSKLALQFFDGLTDLHMFGYRERCWLECASILHDIGLSKPGGGHHKKSMELILDETRLPLASQDRQVIACIARYHRKGLPKAKHYNLASLDSDLVVKVTTLASFLRVADGLDYTHEASVESISFNVSTKKVIVECKSGTKSLLEEEAFNKKKDLFEKVFDKKLVLAWK
ncbi:MAG: YfcE family phosphodiesterase [Candidatus Bathyarchaeota archaeon]|nr:YfcE family phosphodiesterase [Candidatus Bathyarchaeota archaeon]